MRNLHVSCSRKVLLESAGLSTGTLERDQAATPPALIGRERVPPPVSGQADSKAHEYMLKKQADAHLLTQFWHLYTHFQWVELTIDDGKVVKTGPFNVLKKNGP
jgi:hypothetical protein